MMRISGLYKSFFVVETHVYNSKDPAEKYENLNFLLLSVCFHFFENYPTQFLSHSESAELVFLQWGSGCSRVSQTIGINVQTGKLMLATSFCG